MSNNRNLVNQFIVIFYTMDYYVVVKSMQRKTMYCQGRMFIFRGEAGV